LGEGAFPRTSAAKDEFFHSKKEFFIDDGPARKPHTEYLTAFPHPLNQSTAARRPPDMDKRTPMNHPALSSFIWSAGWVIGVIEARHRVI
jgi:hypothetical protein